MSSIFSSSGRPSTKLLLVFWPIVATITFLLLYGAWWSYLRFGYTSDGFHVYSAMRNFVEGIGSWGLWEGPTFEHKMGNHSFLVLFLFLPLIWLIRTPFVLVLLSAFSHLVATRFVFNWAKKYFKSDALISILFGLFFLFYLSGFVFFTGSHSLFIPEVLLPPTLLAMVYALQKKSAAGFLAAYFFLLLIKEEFLLTSPSMILWCAVLDLYFIRSGLFRSGLFRTRRFWLQVIGVYLAGFALSAGSTAYYRSINQFNHAHLTPNLDFVFHPLAHIPEWLDCVSVMRRLLTPAIPVIAVALWLGSRSARLFLLFSIFVFVSLRCAGNLILYHVTRDISHWTYVVIAPTLFVALFECLKERALATRLNKLILTVALLLSLGVSLRYDRGVFSYTFFRDWVWGEQALAEHEPRRAQFARIYKEVLEKIGPNTRHERMAIAVPEYFIWPFMDRSHVSIEWLLDNGKFSTPWVQDYIHHIVIPDYRKLKIDDQLVIDTQYRLIATPEGHKLYELNALRSVRVK